MKRCRGCDWKGPERGASVPMELGCITLPVWMCLPIDKLSEPHTVGILRRLSYVSMINY